MDLAKISMFPKAKIKIGGKKVEYSSIYNWFNFIETFEKHPKQDKVKFDCIVCGKVINEKLGKPGNLLKHIKIHKEGLEWAKGYEIFKNENNFKPTKVLDKKKLCLVKFFLSSNIAMKALENKYLREALSFKLSRYSFKEVILPEMIVFLKEKISRKLMQAEFICLITDIWTNVSMVDYLALGASIINSAFIKEILIIGMIKMPGVHNAENIKIAIESIINRLDFNKAKISSVVTDEGSNMLRLFKQINDSLYINISVDNIDDIEIDQDADNVENSENEIAVSLNENSFENEENEESFSSVETNNFDEDETSDSNHESDKFDDDDQNDLNNEDVDPNPINYFEVNEILSETFQNPVNYITSSRNIENVIELISDDDSDEYDLINSNRKVLNCLNLVIGSTNIPRYSCACHKANLAIRKAIKQSSYFSDLLSTLSRHASTIKKSIVLSNRHNKNKCKIHRQQFTRWSSSFMMLFSYLKSYKRCIFNDYNKCPVSEEEIEKYIQILLPMYIFTNDIQSKTSNISCIIPSLLSIIYANLDRMVLADANQSEFRDNLIYFIKQKFEYEMNSKVYLVAAILNVETLAEWRDRSYAKAYFKKALDSIFEVTKMFENNESTHRLDSPERSTQIDENASRSQGLVQLSRLLRSKSSQQIENSKDTKIKEEIQLFISLISEISIQSTKAFWLDYKNRLPNMFLLALRLFNISPASSSIEQFFSVSGLICKETASNIDDELLINRALLKINLNLLE